MEKFKTHRRILWVLALGIVATYLFKTDRPPDRSIAGSIPTETVSGDSPLVPLPSPATRVPQSQRATTKLPIVVRSMSEKAKSLVKPNSPVTSPGTGLITDEMPQPTELTASEGSPSGARSNSQNSHPEIGRPFPLSDSLSTACKDRRWCIELALPMLDQFAKEPRDQEWASRIEAELGKYVQAQDPREFVLRVVECRTTLCFMEVASPAGEAFYDGAMIDNKINGLKEIKDKYLDTVVEDVPVYNVKVSLLIYKRR